jgi:dCMP deaminase
MQTKKRTDYLSWDNYFMGVAILSSMRSKDPNTQVGACIVNTKKRIIGIGYNGLPVGLNDDEFPWGNQGGFLDTKYPYVVHAEPNAILNSIEKLDNATIYVTLFPCNECAKLIIQSGIKEIVYIDDKYKNTEADIASKKMLDAAGVSYRKLEKISIEVK